MSAETNLSAIAPPVSDEEKYQLWEEVKADHEVPPLLDNPTMAQLRSKQEKRTRKSKAKAWPLAVVVSTTGLSQRRHAGDETIRGMQVLSFIREFELQNMKESETIT